LIQSVIVVFPETGFEENLDELLNLWYVQQSLQFESLTVCFYSKKTPSLPDFPDSVYIHRLQSLPFVMDLTYNRIVKNFIDLYTKQRRDRVRVMLTLTHYYFPIFEEVFDRHGIPHELKYLAIIESALNPRAVSKAGATGLWQFMLSTGKSYGLMLIPLLMTGGMLIKATEVCSYFFLKTFTVYIKDWTLVIAAYNCGPGNVNKAIRRAGGKSVTTGIYIIFFRAKQEVMCRHLLLHPM
jgi:membrane-bound lytic murein transglycosylase D